MSVNGITSSVLGYQEYNKTTKKRNSEEIATSEKTLEQTSSEKTGILKKTPSSQAAFPENAAIYTKSNTSAKQTNGKADPATIQKLQQEAEKKTAQFKALVEQLITKQGSSIGATNSIWSMLRNGEVTVDAATKAKAQADIAEDGYWGVEQTSDRIVDFAKALSGGDKTKLDELKAAFEKGFKQATKTWGDKLPEISQKTYEAVMQKFDSWENE